jgi:hypothetical protein
MSSHHNNEEKWTRGCCITFPLPHDLLGAEKQHQQCFGEYNRKSLSLTQHVSFTLAAMAGGENFSRKGKRVL